MIRASGKYRADCFLLAQIRQTKKAKKVWKLFRNVILSDFPKTVSQEKVGRKKWFPFVEQVENAIESRKRRRYPDIDYV